jgi:hypothetical protein
VPDIEALNAVAAADIATVNAVAKADIATVNGVAMLSGAVAATHWATCGINTYISWVAAADLADVTAWEGNVFLTEQAGSAETVDIAYGKDGSGNGMFMMITNNSGNNLRFDGNNDITDDSAWTRKNLPSSAKQKTIAYSDGDGESDSSSGNAVTRSNAWIVGGLHSSSNANIRRSIDGGANWTAVDISGLTNFSTSTGTDTGIYGLAGDGTGNWMFGQKGNLYFSSDSGVSWSYLVQPFGGAGTDRIYDIVYTNGSWVVFGKVGGNGKVVACVGAVATSMDDASADWGTIVHLTAASGAIVASQVLSARMAAANGRIVVIDSSRTMAISVSGKTITIESDRIDIDTGSVVNSVATDGITWLIGVTGASSGGTAGGDLYRSTDNGENWTQIVNGFGASGNQPFTGIAPNVYLPL